MTICSVPGCTRDAKTRGWCSTHYERWRVHGDPEFGKPARPLRPRTTIGRFWAKVRADHETGCWNWQGAAHSRGYGRMNIAGQYVQAYRFAYEHFIGPIPQGLELDHLCRNPRCVNPEHLEPVTHGENTRRMIEANFRTPTCKRGHDREVFMRQRPSGSDYCLACARELQRERSNG